MQDRARARKRAAQHLAHERPAVARKEHVALARLPRNPSIPPTPPSPIPPPQERSPWMPPYPSIARRAPPSRLPLLNPSTLMQSPSAPLPESTDFGPRPANPTSPSFRDHGPPAVPAPLPPVVCVLTPYLTLSPTIHPKRRQAHLEQLPRRGTQAGKQAVAARSVVNAGYLGQYLPGPATAASESEIRI